MLSYRPTGLYNRIRTKFSVYYLQVIEYIFLYSLSVCLSLSFCIFHSNKNTRPRTHARTHARTHFEISVQRAYRIRFILNCNERILLCIVEYISRIAFTNLTLRRLMSYIYGAPILGVSRSHTTTQHSR